MYTTKKKAVGSEETKKRKKGEVIDSLLEKVRKEPSYKTLTRVI